MPKIIANSQQMAAIYWSNQLVLFLNGEMNTILIVRILRSREFSQRTLILLFIIEKSKANKKLRLQGIRSFYAIDITLLMND